MQPNPDPKPGRWILPVVILAMMGFAWLFINAAEDPTVTATATTVSGGSSGATTTTSVPPSGTTTSTTLPVDVVQYKAAITSKGLELAGIQERIAEANSNWNARTVGYAETLSALRALDDEVKAWRTSIDGVAVPTSLPEFTGFHSIMATAATQVSKISGDIVVGLQAPDSGEARTVAVAAFNQATTAYGNQVNAIVDYQPPSS